MEQVIRIEPRRSLLRVGWAEIWAYRELFGFLVWRDVKVRYKQTALGAAWAVLQPALSMVVFTFVFGRFAGIPSDGIPYPLFSFAGLLPWQYLASAVSRSGQSVVASSNLVSKVYFPRLIVPLAAAAAPLVDLAVGLVFMGGMMAWYSVVPSWRLLALPAIVAFALLAGLSISLWLSALNVRYRDVMYLIPFFVQIWMFLSPVAYPSSLVPAKWKTLFALNPAAGILDSFRWALLGEKAPAPQSLVPSIVVVAALLAGGILYFHATEDTFSDVI
jgi:lipopolysaccharide transport system permease protein